MTGAKVLYLDHDPNRTKKHRERIKHLLDLSGINYTYRSLKDDPPSDKELIEKLLGPDICVLLIHPGVENAWMLEEYPKKYPGLEIVVLTEIPTDYKEVRGGIRVFNYKNTYDIDNFITSKVRDQEKHGEIVSPYCPGNATHAHL